MDLQKTHSSLILGSLHNKFAHQLINNSGPNGCIKLYVTQANRDVLKIFADHLQGKTIQLEPITVWKVIAFAKKYQIDSLLIDCLNYLQDNITLANCIQALKEIQQTLASNHTIKYKLQNFMKIHFHQV